MIVQERQDRYVLIKQYDHSLLSGEFARRWAESPRPFEPTLYAIANHDIGWKGLDATVRWNETTGKPYSFTSYPVGPKLRAYKEGLDLLERQSPYAACLCSMHFESFVRGSEDEAEARFREGEIRRQQKLMGVMSVEELENIEHNFRLLQLCDDLSLFVCLNEPGRNDYPWFKNGFEFEGAKFEPVWEDSRTRRLDPNPFSGPFGLALPYTLVEKSGKILGSRRLELQVTC
jgi:Protein of unknown function (DUF3891)